MNVEVLNVYNHSLCPPPPLLPLLALITHAFRTIYVCREDSNSRMRAAEDIQARAHSGGAWPKILVFAEGTQSSSI